MDDFRRRMLIVPIGALTLTMLLIPISYVYHGNPAFKLAVVGYDALVLLLVSGLIVRSWFRRGAGEQRPAILVAQVALLILLVVGLDLALHQLG